MEISIKTASETMKVSRTTIYEKLKNGELSKTQSGKIETSELLRVFGSPANRHTKQEESEHIEHLKSVQNPDKSSVHQLNTLDTLDTSKEELYQAQIKSLEEQLKEANEREKWQRQHIEKLTDTLKLLEAPKQPEPKKKGFLSRFFHW
jgi:excisionase family DNA binding protein